MSSAARSSFFYAIAAYVAWGGFPLFWRYLKAIPALEVVSHRVLWSALFLSVLLWQRRLWPEWSRSLRSGRNRIYFLSSSVLITCNWLIYIWAVNSNHVLETSLGYFINPLLSIALGLIVFRERLRFWQWFCLILACFGVLLISLQAAQFPWIALGLAGSFAGYGLLRKQMPIDSLVANQIDAMFISVPALGYIIWLIFTGKSVAIHATALELILLAAGGIITAFPLIWFARAARGLPMSTMGFLQYIAPSLQFCIGLYIFHEPFSRAQFFAYLCIWIALIALVIENRLSLGSRTSNSPKSY